MKKNISGAPGREDFSPFSYDLWDEGEAQQFLHEKHGWPDVDLPIWPYFSIENKRRDRRWFRHINYPRVALELVLAGTIEYSNDSQSAVASAGMVYVILRGSNVRFVNADDRLSHKLTLLFQGALTGTLCDALGFHTDTVVRLRDPEKFEQDMRRAIVMMEARQPGSEAELSKLAYGLWLDVAADHDHSEYPAELRRAVLLMENHVAEELFIDSVAAAVQLSPATLRRHFKRFLSTTPAQYLTRLRLLRAGNLLETGMSVKESAIRSGFRDPLYFSRLFKKFHGIAPGTFRKLKSTVIRSESCR